MWQEGETITHLKEIGTIQLICACRDVALILPLLLIFHLKDVQSFLCCLLAFKCWLMANRKKKSIKILCCKNKICLLAGCSFQSLVYYLFSRGIWSLPQDLCPCFSRLKCCFYHQQHPPLQFGSSYSCFMSQEKFPCSSRPILLHVVIVYTHTSGSYFFLLIIFNLCAWFCKRLKTGSMSVLIDISGPTIRPTLMSSSQLQ